MWCCCFFCLFFAFYKWLLTDLKMDIVELGNNMENNLKLPTKICNDIYEFNDSVNDNCFSVLTQNITSINKNLDNFLVHLELANYKFDVIILTETWKVDCIDYYKIQGYNVSYNHGRFNQNDGVVVFIKNKWESTCREQSIGGLNVLKFSIKISNTNLVCLNTIYRPPEQNLDIFLENLSDYLALDQTANLGIVVGDFNVDILRGERRNRVNDYLDAIHELGYISLINEYTRERNCQKSCLDHILINNAQQLRDYQTFIIKTKITDHHAAVLTIPLNNTTKETTHMSKTSFVNFNKLKSILHREEWTNVYRHENPDKSMNVFMEILNTHIQKTTKTRMHNGFKKRTPWITDGIVKSIEHRDKLYKLTKEHPNDENLKERYKRYRNIIHVLLKKSKNEYYEELLLENKNYPRKFWKTIRTALNIKQSENLIGEIRNKNGNSLKKDKDKSEYFNEFFVKVGKNLAQRIRIPDQREYLKNFERRYNIKHSAFLRPVEETELKNTILSLKTNTAPGFDKISPLLLKNIVNFILKPLLHILNNCFLKGICPSYFKISNVKPLFKNGDRTDCTNYRPISLISVFSKIFEKLLKKRIVNFIEKHKILNKNQFGFRRGLGTEEALCHVSTKIYSSLEKSSPAAGIFLDLRKAFDTVDLDLLLFKLEVYGFRGVVLELLKNYLKERVQRVVVGSEESSERVIECGVPQGTVLGPVLFILYLNDFLDYEEDFENVAFADDTVCLMNGKTWEEINTKCQNTLKIIKNWLDLNVLSLNWEKTKFLPFYIDCRSKPQSRNIVVHDSNCKDVFPCRCSNQIETVHKTKYLGIILDSQMQFKYHAESTTAKLRKIIFLMNKLRLIMNKTNLKIIYHSLFESILQYGIIVWGSSYDSAIGSLEITQKWCIKSILCKNRRYPTDSLFQEFRVLRLKQLYSNRLLHYVSKHPTTINLLNKKSYITRQIGQSIAEIPKKSNRVAQKCISYMAPKIFNLLSTDLKNLLHFTLKFKKCTKAFVLNMDYQRLISNFP